MRELFNGVRKLATDMLAIVTSLERIKALWRHPLYSNAIYIMLAKVTDAIVGFVFWIVAARLYSTEQVGQASALLSSATLLAALSGIGLGYGLIRFLSDSASPVTLINSSFTLVGVISAIAVVIYVLGPGLWSPAVVSVRHQPGYLALFIMAAPACALAGLADNTYIARRAGRFVLARNLVFNALRLVLPVVLAAYLQSFGLFASWGAAIGASLLFSLFLFMPRAQPGYRVSVCFDRKVVGHMFRFSFANYLSDLLWTGPILILQSIVVTNRLGSESNAYLAVAWAMGTTLTALPSAASMSLFAEGSHDEGRLGQSVRQSLKMTFLILTPAVVLVVLLADKILLVFRPEYSEGATTLLRLFAVAAFPLAINSLYFGTKRVQREMGAVILLIALAGGITLGLSYVLMRREGVAAVGIGWLVAQACVSVVVIADWVRGHFRL